MSELNNNDQKERYSNNNTSFFGKDKNGDPMEKNLSHMLSQLISS